MPQQKPEVYDYSRNTELIAAAQGGDKEAMDELVRCNMGLVRSIVPRFSERGVEYDDLMQIGTIGMIKAIRSYSPDYQTVFSTYAVPLIIGEIRRFLRDDGIIKVGRTTKRLSTHVMKQKEKFISQHGREPKLSELCELCECTQDELVVALEASSPMHSLSESVCDDDSMTLEGVIPAKDDDISNLCDLLSLREAVKSLDDTERRIIYLRYFRDLSQQQTADALGISQVKVSRTEKRIYEKLRKQLSG